MGVHGDFGGPKASLTVIGPEGPSTWYNSQVSWMGKRVRGIGTGAVSLEVSTPLSDPLCRPFTDNCDSFDFDLLMPSRSESMLMSMSLLFKLFEVVVYVPMLLTLPVISLLVPLNLKTLLLRLLL